MTTDEQLTLWQQGTSVHMGDKKEGGQCCPDFSCCRPDIHTPQEVRDVYVVAFRSGNETVTMRLLGEFLGNALASRNVHIAGLEASRMEVDE
jgi:hypothetical protein